MEGHAAAGGQPQGRRELEELVAARRRFVVPAMGVFVVYFGAFLICVGYAQDFMATKAIGAFSWAYLWALTLILLTWGIAWAYLRYAERTLAPLAERALEAGSSRPEGPPR